MTTNDDRIEWRFRRLADACLIASALAFVLGLVWIYKRGHASSVSMLLGFVCACTLACMFYCCFHALTAKANHIAAKRFRSAAARDARSPFVVLRPFKQDGLAFPLSHLVARGRKGDARSYLNEIGEAVSPFGVLLAIGNPTATVDFYSTPQLLYFQAAENCWPAIFRAASEVARAVILIPARSPGVIEEMRVLANDGKTAKTIVFMPPTPVQSTAAQAFLPQISAERIRDEWEQVRTYWATSAGLFLPAYCSQGLLFVPREDYSCRVGANLDGKATVAALREGIVQLLPHLGGSASTLSHFIAINAPYQVAPPKPSFVDRILGQGG